MSQDECCSLYRATYGGIGTSMRKPQSYVLTSARGTRHSFDLMDNSAWDERTSEAWPLSASPSRQEESLAASCCRYPYTSQSEAIIPRYNTVTHTQLRTVLYSHVSQHFGFTAVLLQLPKVQLLPSSTRAEVTPSIAALLVYLAWTWFSPLGNNPATISEVSRISTVHPQISVTSVSLAPTAASLSASMGGTCVLALDLVKSRAM